VRLTGPVAEMEGRGDSVAFSVRHTPRVPRLCIAQDAAAGELLSRDPLALLIGMLLDHNVRE
jgi:hypothetical protein